MSGAPAVAAPAKRGADLALGDVLANSRGERSRTITRFEQYPNPERFAFMDKRWRVAWSGGDWSITIDPDALYRLSEDGVWAIAHHVDLDGRWVR